ncbi:3-oxoacyl-ACP synthase III family protein [Umezawaea tangerina]|uniref:3-oxoacyl-[acyl-carrier-protein] synthase-3 n=1 Tax=Umezawaea tangerina TaxID=84725 RepID=A0A2T0THM8_9PSEU|nr:3-oxoacyl-[acyl-carrier-protein] synthase III C-terminal domain-containing protein [Umezawaea tangerina]PRY45204.1 3-oxoacyl-[acyl-carrier-protein] synthase-3 [Umezawaea tangerina]
MAYGLVAFGTAMGEEVAVKDVVAEYTEDVERVLGYGYDHVHRAAPGVGLTDLAVDAGRSALAAAGLAPRDVDLLVLAVTDLTEYLYWDAAAATAHGLGLRRAEAVLVDQGCVGGVTAFDAVAGRFATHPGYRTALVIGANRTVEAYWNRLDTHSLLFSDGAAATVVTRESTSLRWLASHAETDGAYADFFRMDIGGGAEPFAAGSPAPMVRDAWDIMEHFGYDSERFAAFADEINDRTARAVHRACKQARVTEEDLRWLVLLNDNTRVLTAQADLVGVPTARTNLRWAGRNGHFGAADHLFFLAALRESDEPDPGDLVALAANGRGMHWASAIFSW